jgi:NADH:ubiquinone oxidoreductase subunit D
MIIGYTQDLLPNGVITNSSNRLVFVVGWIVLFAMAIFYAIAGVFWKVPTDYALLGMVAGFVTGQKMYQKYVEQGGVTTDTPKPETKEEKI